jgi:hypothetical protein
VTRPEPLTPFTIGDGLEQVRLWELVDRRIRLRVTCQAWRHSAVWGPDFMDRRLGRQKAARLVTIAWRLRCSRCGRLDLSIRREREPISP